MSLSDRWLLVTGASSGLGRRMALQLAVEHGANLVLVARREPQLKELETEILSKSRSKVVTLAADLTDIAQVDGVVRDACEGRPLYGAILNAGITYFGAHERLDWPTFTAMPQTNVVGVVRMTNALVGPLEAAQAAREGIEAIRRRKRIYVPGATNRLGLQLSRLLPGQFLNARVAATYRRALTLAGHFSERATPAKPRA